MAYSSEHEVSLDDLIEELRSRGDIPKHQITPATLKRWLQGGLDKLYGLVVKQDPDAYTDSLLMSIVSGTGEYDLPDDFFKSRGLDVLESEEWYRLKRFNMANRNRMRTGPAWRRAVRYRIVGKQIALRPVPEWSATNGLKLWYIPQVVKLLSTALGDASNVGFDFVSGWDEYVILTGLVKWSARDDQDPSIHLAERAETLQMIYESLPDQDVGEPDRVRVEEEFPDWPSYHNP